MRESGGPPAPGPLFNQPSAPQLADGQTIIRPVGGVQTGATYTASTVDAAGVYTYEELWATKLPGQLLANNLIAFVSAEPVDWATARAELNALGVTVYAPMRFQYYPPPTVIPQEVSALARVKEFDVRVTQFGAPENSAGRMLRTQYVPGGNAPVITVDHWLLGPSFQPPSTSAGMHLLPKLGNVRTLTSFIGSPQPGDDWLYVQAIYQVTPNSPIVDV
jgi:hypothetical protein